MNRRNVISIVAVALMLPMSLVAAPKKGKPPAASCKDCKKCGRACKCDCKKGCKCKPGCCKSDRPSPHGKRPSGFDGRSPNFGPPQGRPSPDRDSRYKEIISKFDKNKDGKLDEKERAAARKFIQERFRSER